MKKTAGSNIVIWKSTKGNYFNLKVEVLGVLLSVYPDRHPKSFTRIENWFNDTEGEVINPILFAQEFNEEEEEEEEGEKL